MAQKPTKTSGPIPVTVAIPVKNEVKNLIKCLPLLSRFQSVFVIDSASTDGSLDVCKKYNIPVIDFDWDGKYPKKRNWFLLTQRIETEWILFLDADEFVNEQFCEEVEQKVCLSSYSAYWITYNNYFMGHLMRYGVKQRKLALFRVDCGLYEKIDEDQWSALDMEVHEHPIIRGEIGHIQSAITHRDFKGIAPFLTKHVDYARWEAQRFAALHASGQSWNHLTRRQRFKYKHMAKAWYPYFYFLITYVVKFGFLDGAQGLHYASLKKWYFKTIRLLIAESAEHSQEEKRSASLDNEDR